MLKLEKYSIGVGDRFAHQAKAQLKACQMLLEQGLEVPVWNKSNRARLHWLGTPSVKRPPKKQSIRWVGNMDGMWTLTTSGSTPLIATSMLGFFTIDVADFIGKDAPVTVVEDFLRRHPELLGACTIEGLEAPLEMDREEIFRVASKYLQAVQEASNVYQYIVDRLEHDELIAEVSMDETDSPQRPHELLIILAAMADEGIPAQTIAPKFARRFNKGWIM